MILVVHGAAGILTGDFQSYDYEQGLQGWFMGRDGRQEVAASAVRGLLTANQIESNVENWEPLYIGTGLNVLPEAGTPRVNANFVYVNTQVNIKEVYWAIGVGIIFTNSSYGIRYFRSAMLTDLMNDEDDDVTDANIYIDYESSLNPLKLKIFDVEDNRFKVGQAITVARNVNTPFLANFKIREIYGIKIPNQFQPKISQVPPTNVVLLLYHVQRFDGIDETTVKHNYSMYLVVGSLKASNSSNLHDHINIDDSFNPNNYYVHTQLSKSNSFPSNVRGGTDRYNNSYTGLLQVYSDIVDPRGSSRFNINGTSQRFWARLRFSIRNSSVGVKGDWTNGLRMTNFRYVLNDRTK